MSSPLASKRRGSASAASVSAEEEVEEEEEEEEEEEAGIVCPLSSVCNDSYVGRRCEQFQLELLSDNSHETGMIAAIVILLILILLVLAVVIYCICKVRMKEPGSTKAGSKSQQGAI
ncbi:hypothetical protein Q7C36_015191 [Tachysurus vachellii]|uniref:Uncharacterized protein n=1 Tax=Tachysurus vachellii TaxID=175792 RepID=A0AA88ME70_TACVA|nr:hypothetical protein Q7C36_015191 [Tachysurus vachellii]